MNIREISDIFKDTADNITAIKSYNFGWASDRVRQGNTEDYQELNQFPRIFFSVPTITGSDQTRKQDTYQVTLFFDDLLGYDNEGDADLTLQIDKWAALQQYATAFIQRLNLIKQTILPNYLFIPEAPQITFDSFVGIQRLVTVQVNFNLVVPTNCEVTLQLTIAVESSVDTIVTTSADATLTKVIEANATATAETTSDASLSYTVNAEATAIAETSADAQITRIISAEATATANSSAEAGIGVTFVAAAVGVATSSEANLSRTATMEASSAASANVTAATITTVDNVSASVSGTATVTNANLQLFDPNFSSVSLLLHCNGADGSTSFIDNSISPSILTGVGNTQLDTTFKQFGTASIQFDGTGDRITTGSNAKFSFGTGNFTVEGWFYENNRYLYATFIEIGNHLNSNGIIFLTKNGNTPTRFGIYSGAFFGNDLAPNLNSWNHIAWVRNNGVLRMYVNGVGGTAVSFTNNLTDTATITIGSRLGGNANYDFNGYIDEIRITKGVARYTAASFTVPTREFLDQ